jgi:uncharacterized protein YjbI with pentapeptide repeats
MVHSPTPIRVEMAYSPTRVPNPKTDILWCCIKMRGSELSSEFIVRSLRPAIVMVMAKGKKPWTLREYAGKPVWDWMDLLIVPLVLALVTIVFTWQQDARQQNIEGQRAKAERKLAEQRAQDEALQAYLSQMGSLLLEKNLLTSKQTSEVLTLARARTATVIQRLDAEGNGSVIRFLNEANLTGSIPDRSSISLLAQADLQGAHFEGVDLSSIDLSEASLSEASLSDAYLYHADLSAANMLGADLYGADLSDAYLGDAYLGNAYLGDADLSDAYLGGADLSDADLNRADLGEANLSNAYLGGADLSDADLSGANLSDASLFGANLSGANLGGADLYGADLNRADLRSATGVTNEELERQAEDLAGATMPDGSKHP